MAKKIFPRMTKDRLAEPSKICALDFKYEFRRSTGCSVSATIGIDWPILGIFREDGATGLAKKGPSAMGNENPSIA